MPLGHTNATCLACRHTYPFMLVCSLSPPPCGFAQSPPRSTLQASTLLLSQLSLPLSAAVEEVEARRGGATAALTVCSYSVLTAYWRAPLRSYFNCTIACTAATSWYDSWRVRSRLGPRPTTTCLDASPQPQRHPGSSVEERPRQRCKRWSREEAEKVQGRAPQHADLDGWSTHDHH